MLEAVVSAPLSPVTQSRAGRECPVCAEVHRVLPKICSAELAARAWVPCFDCGGTGWDTTGEAIWCPTCGGAKISEAAQ